MAKLWVFGDSFSAEKQTTLQKFDTLMWHEVVASNLNVEISNFAHYGVSNDFLFLSVMSNLENITENDLVLFQFTSFTRKWFFKENPELGNYHVVRHLDNDGLKRKQLSKNTILAIDMYIEHLQNLEADKLSYERTYYALQHVLKEKNVRFIPGFHTVPGVKGTLLEASNQEFVNEKEQKKWNKKYPIDFRQNHFSEDNHKILGDKITKFIWGDELDLTTGFNQNFLKVEK